MKYSVLISALLFVMGILIMIIQLWFSVWSSEFFIKILITISLFFIISIAISFVYKEIRATHRLKHGEDVDD